MVGAQALAVALADFGQDVDPVPRLHTVVGLDVQRPLRLNDLEHLQEGRVAASEGTSIEQRVAGEVFIVDKGDLCGI